MEITPTPISTSVKSPELLDTEIPTRIQPGIRPLNFTNGFLKRHHQQPLAPVVVVYKECLKNHAATLGGHALDGCGEFMPSPSATATNPTSLKCAACGCHRNFHRREPEDASLLHTPPKTTATIEYQSHHRHHPLPPPVLPPPLSGHLSPNSSSPPPISSSYYPSAPHMLLALSGGASAPQDTMNFNQSLSPNMSRKRFRTKFSQTQKEKMFELAERVSWKMQKRDENLVHDFCHEIGVERGVFKVWMHNNKHTLARKDFNGTRISSNNGNVNANGGDGHEIKNDELENGMQCETHVGNNGSSSSS